MTKYTKNKLYSVSISLSLITNIYYKKTLLYVEYKHSFFFQNVTQEVFLQHISTLQHVLLLLHTVHLIDNQFLFTCSPICVQRVILVFKFVIYGTDVENTLSLTYPHKKKSRGVISGDRGGQDVGPSHPIHLFGNGAPKNQMLQILRKTHDIKF